jgi:hypothetical protein
LASRIIETLLSSVDKNAGLYVFDLTANGKNKAILPILLRNREKHFQYMDAVYRGEGDKIWMRLVTRSLEGVCDYFYYMFQYYNIQDKGKPAQLKLTKPSSTLSLSYVFPCSLNGAYDQLQCLIFIPTSSQATVIESNHLLRLNDSIEIIRNGWLDGKRRAPFS